MAVLGAGNVLLGDDGVGVAVLDALRRAGVERRFPGVQLIEAGTAAFEAVALLDEGVTHLIVIDAVNGGGPAGAVYRFTLDDIDEEANPHRTSLHQVTLLEALQLAELSGRRFERTVVIGVEPQMTSWGTALSAAARARIPQIVDLVAAEIARLARGPV